MGDGKSISELIAIVYNAETSTNGAAEEVIFLIVLIIGSPPPTLVSYL